MRFTSISALGLGAFLSISRFVSAQSIEFQSEAAPTSLLELYTSEGCSSCPPAEAWLSRLKESPRLWKEFVPVAFHVDYWDHLGWRDPLAAQVYSERQRAYAKEWRHGSVYTPGFVLDGKEWRGWFKRDQLPRASQTRVGLLTARSQDGKHWTLRFQPSENNNSSYSSSCDFHVALLGFGLNSEVKAGENRGQRLEHDFAVLALAKTASSKNGDSFQGEVALDAKVAVSPRRLALAAWITPAGSLRPLQALGGWLASTNRAP